jgi:hypothetical protein
MSIYIIPPAAVPVVAEETRATLAATDKALLAHANLLAAVIEGVQGSNLPVNVTQDMLTRIVAHGGKLVDGREDLRRLITTLTTVKNRSDQREVATGCPNGLPDLADAIFTGAQLPARETAQV